MNFSITPPQRKVLLSMSLSHNPMIAADPVLASLAALIARGRHAEAETLAHAQKRRLLSGARRVFLALRAEIALGLGRFAASLEWACEALKTSDVADDLSRGLEAARIRALLGLARLREAEARVDAFAQTPRSHRDELSLFRAQLALRRGLLADAKREVGFAVEAAVTARRRPALVEALQLKARVERESGDRTAAKRDLDRAERLSNGLRNTGILAEVLSERADLLAHSGDWVAARADASQSCRLFARASSPHEHLTAGPRSGLLDLARGDLRAALALIERAADMARRGFGTPGCRAEIDLLLADARLAANDPEGALDRATAALWVFRDSNDSAGRARAHVQRSLAALSTSNPGLALREAKLAAAIPGSGGVARGLADLALGRVLFRQDRGRAAEPFSRALQNHSLYPPLRTVAHLGLALARGAEAGGDCVRQQVQAIEAFGDRRVLSIVQSDLHELFGLEARSSAPPVEVVTAGTEVERDDAAEFLPGLIGSSGVVLGLAEVIRRAARRDMAISIYGETGTGKDRIARAIHELSARSARKFVPINAAALSDELFESEVFGHLRGSFTGAHADRPGLVEDAKGGTLFIDEVADLSSRSQARLLRFLNDGTYRRVGENHERRADVRIVVAANQRLEDLVHAGRFRLDLMYRLQGLSVTVPPLRERGRDVLRLGRHFVTAASDGAAFLSPRSEAEVRAYGWPGNVRELEHEMRRAVVLGESNVVEWRRPEATPSRALTSAPGQPSLSVPEEIPGPSSLKNALREIERGFLKSALGQSGPSQVARSLGISRQALHQKITRFGL